MILLEHTIILLLVVVPSSFIVGYRYHKYISRSRVSRPKQQIQVKHGTINSVQIISPSRINEQRNFEKNLTN